MLRENKSDSFNENNKNFLIDNPKLKEFIEKEFNKNYNENYENNFSLSETIVLDHIRNFYKEKYLNLNNEKLIGSKKKQFSNEIKNRKLVNSNIAPNINIFKNLLIQKNLLKTSYPRKSNSNPILYSKSNNNNLHPINELSELSENESKRKLGNYAEIFSKNKIIKNIKGKIKSNEVGILNKFRSNDFENSNFILNSKFSFLNKVRKLEKFQKKSYSSNNLNINLHDEENPNISSRFLNYHLNCKSKRNVIEKIHNKNFNENHDSNLVFTKNFNNKKILRGIKSKNRDTNFYNYYHNISNDNIEIDYEKDSSESSSRTKKSEFKTSNIFLNKNFNYYLIKKIRTV